MLPAVVPEPLHQSTSFSPLMKRRLGSAADENVNVPEAGASIQPVVTAATGRSAPIAPVASTIPLRSNVAGAAGPSVVAASSA